MQKILLFGFLKTSQDVFKYSLIRFNIENELEWTWLQRNKYWEAFWIQSMHVSFIKLYLYNMIWCKGVVVQCVSFITKSVISSVKVSLRHTSNKVVNHACKRIIFLYSIFKSIKIEHQFNPLMNVESQSHQQNHLHDSSK